MCINAGGAEARVVVRGRGTVGRERDVQPHADVLPCAKNSALCALPVTHQLQGAAAWPRSPSRPCRTCRTAPWWTGGPPAWPAAPPPGRGCPRTGAGGAGAATGAAPGTWREGTQKGCVTGKAGEGLVYWVSLVEVWTARWPPTCHQPSATKRKASAAAHAIPDNGDPFSPTGRHPQARRTKRGRRVLRSAPVPPAQRTLLPRFASPWPLLSPPPPSTPRSPPCQRERGVRHGRPLAPQADLEDGAHDARRVLRHVHEVGGEGEGLHAGAGDPGLGGEGGSGREGRARSSQVRYDRWYGT